MSIYATLWVLRFPSFDQFYIGCDWLTVIAQGVPAHVGADDADQFALFLPPLRGSVAAGLRGAIQKERPVLRGYIGRSGARLSLAGQSPALDLQLMRVGTLLEHSHCGL